MRIACLGIALGVALATRIATAASGDADADAAIARLAARAAERPDDAASPWIVVIGDRESAAAVQATLLLQRREPRNAAAWALSLAVPGMGADEGAGLTRMAAADIYDEHRGAVARAIASELRAAGIVDDVNRRAWLAADSGLLAGYFYAACLPPEPALRDARRPVCVAAMHRVFAHSTHLAASGNAERVLRASHALHARERAHARRLAWWRDAVSRRIDDDDAFARAWFDAVVASDDERLTLEAFARRLGANEPPAQWRWPPPAAVPMVY